MPLRKDDKEYPIYRAWVNMRYRCKNPTGSNRSYVGITYDKRWENFDNFYSDMAESWRVGLSIDRINSTGNYSKRNCRWITMLEQMNNKRTNRLIAYQGEVHNLRQWSKLLGIKETTIRQRIDVYGWSVEKALSKLTKEVYFALT